MTQDPSARRFSCRLAAALSISCAIGCGPQFDPPSEVKSLRVLGIQKDKPYAQPGDTVELRMLWHDGAEEGEREIQRAWFAGCTNPFGDLYQGCFPELVAAGAVLQGGPLPPGIAFGLGDVFSFGIPADIISGRPPPASPNQPSYGLSFVFFAACAGTLTFAAPEDELALPLRCLDENETPLGPEDFVAGYTAIYSFAGIGNQNPMATGFEFRGQALTPDCIGSACVPEAEPGTMPEPVPDRIIDCANPEDAPRCIPACEDDGDTSCDEHPLRLLVDPASAEGDAVSEALYGRSLGEQMWINYYVDGGALRSPVRLLNDASTGWNEESGTDFFAPVQPGPVKIWAVAHDNRGGTDFARITVQVQ